MLSSPEAATQQLVNFNSQITFPQIHISCFSYNSTQSFLNKLSRNSLRINFSKGFANIWWFPMGPHYNVCLQAWFLRILFKMRTPMICGSAESWFEHRKKNPLSESHVVMNLHQFISLHLHLPSQISSTDWAWASPYHFNNFFLCSAGGKWWKFIKFMGRERNDYQEREKVSSEVFSSFSALGALCITNFVTFHARCFNTFLSLPPCSFCCWLGWVVLNKRKRWFISIWAVSLKSHLEIHTSSVPSDRSLSSCLKQSHAVNRIS